MHLEQTDNLSLITRQGAGLMLSKWDLNRCSLGCTMEKLLSESTLRENMLRLKSLQDKVDVSTVAAGEIMKFLGATNNGRKEVTK
jgi:UDP:flavonoid glycosyltransferase YjiC (YdhE family)